MANRFLSNININDEYTLPSADGSANQVITTDGAGNLSFIDVNSVIDTATGEVYYTVKNSTGSTLSKGKAVMAVGSDGNSGHILVDEMIADGSVEPKYFLGVLAENIGNGNTGKAIHFGQIDQFDTRGQNGETWVDGSILWCDPDSAGDFTITEPDGPNVKIAAAIVLNASTNGKIQVRVQANEGIHDLHDTKITSQVDGDVLVWDDTTGVWFNNSTLNVDYTAGNVGIGTTSPSQKLDVNGNINVGDDLTGVIYFATSTTGPTILGTNPLVGGQLIFYTGGSERIRINSTGNVGIGTTSPSEKLEVDGNVKISGSNRELILETLPSNNYRIQLQNNFNSTNRFNLISGGVPILGSKTINSISRTAYINGFGGISFHTSTSITDGNQQMYLDQSGNLGIGTTNPAVKLHIGNETGELFRLDDSSDTGNPFMTFYQNGLRRSLIQHVDAGNTLSLVSEYGSIRMMTAADGNEVNRFQINNAGRVMFARQGITGSMTASIYDVNITGDDFSDKYLNFWSQDGTNSPRAWLKHSSSATAQELEFNGTFSTGSGYANFAFRRGTTPIMFLNQATQRVGIGTETPSFDLDVTGATGIRVSSPTDLPLRVLSTDATCGIELADSSQAYYILTTGSDFRIRDNTGGNVDRLTIEGTTGNVGIGEVAPDERLHVADDGSTTVIIEDTDTSKISNANLNFKAAGVEIVKMSALVEEINATTGGGFVIETATDNVGGVNSNQLALKNNGNVGIGIGGNNAKLEVNGGVKIGDDTDTANSDKPGTLRYRTSGNNSYVDMCMQTGASTYEWVNIVQNNW